MMPKVSIILAVHNGLPFIHTAIQSILNQTFEDFELILIDDGSNSESKKVFHSFADPRIRFATIGRQLGLSHSLNRAISISNGRYVARMDHDDISLPHRLATQVDFLDRNPNVDVVGSWAHTTGRLPQQTWALPVDDAVIRTELLFNPSLIHSSVMFRKRAFQEIGLSYNAKIKRAQDYELWCEAEGRIRFANINDVLLLYRIHDQQVGSAHASEQIRAANHIRARQLKKLGLQLNYKEKALHHKVSRWKFTGRIDELRSIDNWFSKLLIGNSKTRHFSMEALRRSLGTRWLIACRSAVANGLQTWQIFSQSRFSNNVRFSDKAILWLKCMSRQLGWKTN